MKEFLTFLYLPVFLNDGLWKMSLGPAAGDEPQNRCSSVYFEPPSAEQLKLNSLVLYFHKNQSRTMLCNEGNILVVVCRSTGSVCVLLGACVCVLSGGEEQCVDGVRAVCWVMGC